MNEGFRKETKTPEISPEGLVLFISFIVLFMNIKKNITYTHCKNLRKYRKSFKNDNKNHHTQKESHFGVLWARYDFNR